MKISRRKLSAAIAAAVMAPSLALANFQIEEVVVTATKRAESLQEVPIAVTAIGGEAMEKGNFSNLRSITSRAPSVSFANAQASSSSVSVRVRGIGTVGNNAGFESSVGIFIDGVYQPRPGVALGEFVDMQQVEVLRGPQGTLFGRNTSVGALNIKSKAPVIGESEAFASITAGEYGLLNVKGAYNIPVNDSLAFRVAGSYRERDGVLEAVTPGVDDMHDKDRYLVRAQALWEGENVSVRVIADTSANDENCCVSVGSTPSSDGTPVAGISGYDIDDFQTDSDIRHDKSEQFGISAEVEWETDFGTVTWIPAYRDSEAEYYGDNDWSAAPIFTIPKNNPNEANIESMTQELRIQGTAMDDRLDWLAGVYYSDEDIEELSRIYNGSLTAGAENDLYQEGESWAIFTHNIYQLTDDLSFTLGLRYTEEEKKGGLERSGGQNPACAAAGGGPACLPLITPEALTPAYGLWDDEFEDDAFTYNLNLSYQLNEDMMLYASHSTGFKSGGINLDVTGGQGTFDSESIDAYELGFKSTLADGRVTLNAALFYMDMEDFQLLSFDSAAVQFSVFNVPKGTSEGFELDVVSHITENFVLTTSYAYTDASFPNSCAGSIADQAVLNQCGNKLVNAPENVFVVGFNWDVPVSDDLLLSISPNVRYEDESATNVTDPSLMQDSFTMIDLSVRLADVAETWSLELWGKNLADEATEYRSYGTLSNVPGVQNSLSAYINEPMTYGITGRYNF